MKIEQPDFVGIIGGAFRDAWPIMRSRMRVYGILAAMSALAGLAVPLAYLAPSDAQEQVRVQAAIQPVTLFGAIAVFFAIAAVARTIRPEFKLTFARILGIFGIGLAFGFVTEVGFFLLIVPGVLFLVKWSQSTWTYVLSDGKNPFGESWEMTTGHFWETFGFTILLTMLLTVVISIGVALPVAGAIFVPVLSVVFVPIAFVSYVFAYHVSLLGQMRWMLELRRLAYASTPVIAPSSTSL